MRFWVASEHCEWYLIGRLVIHNLVAITNRAYTPEFRYTVTIVIDIAPCLDVQYTPALIS